MNSIIVMYEDVDKELNMSLYDYIEHTYRYAIPVIVCHVTEEEYANMQKQLKSGCLNERLPRIKELGYNKFRYLIAYDSECKEFLISDYDHPEGVGSYRLNEEGIKYDKMGYKINNHPILTRRQRFEQRIYTTETYKDVIDYYKKKADKDYQIKGEKEILIKLVGRSCSTCNTECTGGMGEKGCDMWSYTIHYKYIK